jgi:filamentous hemagglutinin family protein
VPLAHAGPTGGQVVSGKGSIAQSGTTTDIRQSSQNLSLNWLSFNIAPQETVNFLQPSATAIAVNRISGTNGSQILGHLDANGQVYLINPNGILFGKGAEVNVGGLVASTLDLNDTSFVGRARSFSGSAAASVVNQGTITASNGGYVALLGNHVGNQGVITARLGTVALGAGSAVTLTFRGNSLVHLQIDRSVLKSVAENAGLLHADGGQVVMTAGAKDALLASVVNNTGVIEARTVENHGGTITLLGGMTAGAVKVGGTLDASAPGGTISADGAGGGAGGHIETSAAHVEVARGARVTTAGAKGLYGSWLVDPNEFTVAASGGDISGATLSAELATTSVTLLSSSGAKAGAGNVNVNDAVSWSANTGLTLTASNNVNVNRSITATGASARLAINPATPNGSESASGTGTFNLATGAAINLPNVSASSTTALVIGGTPYTVINRLGSPGSTTGTDLQGINGNLIGHFALGSNIDATATATWNSNGAATPTYAGFTPLGSSPAAFTGAFDGLGHTIGSLFINRPTTGGVGLFGELGSAGPSLVQNLGIVGASVTGANFVGGLVGSSGGGTVINSYVTGRVAGGDSVGGLVGSDYFARIFNSHTSASVSGSMGSIGGLVGFGYADSVSNSYATGSVTGPTAVGGLVGFTRGAIDQSYATGRVSGASDVGGLVGWVGGKFDESTGLITNSYATGQVTGTTEVGGLVGAIKGDYGSVYNSYATGNVSGSHRVGGLIGFNGHNEEANYTSLGMVSNTYATGRVTGDSYVGGLVGQNGSTIVGSHATGKVTGGNEVGGLVGFNGGIGFGFPTGKLGVISNSYATGDVMGTTDVGGLAGFSGEPLRAADYGTTGAITSSHATGAVHGSANVGGLIGYSAQYGNFTTNSYATGAVSGTTNVGGLIGLDDGRFGKAGQVTASYATGSVSGGSNVGGLIGSSSAPVSDSYSLGRVTGSSQLGGLVGISVVADNGASTGSATDSYWNVTTSGRSTSAGGTPLTTAQMQSTANFAGFVFTTTPGATGNNWVMVDANGTLNNAGGAAGGVFPMLASEYSTTVANAHQLQLMAMNTAASYTLGQNVRALGTGSGTDVWSSSGFVPLGNAATAFSGTLDGQGHAITNLTISRPTMNDVGLFGHTGSTAVVRNVGLTDARVSGSMFVGALVGLDAGSVSNAYATGSVRGSGNVGGLVGANRGIMSNDYASVAVSGTRALGGLVGWNAAGTIQDSYASGSVSGSNTVGGLVGFNGQGATVTLDYATGRVSGSSAVGGLVGYNSATGTGGIVSNSYWNVNTSGRTTSAGGGTGLTTTQMQTASNFKGFHFTTTPGALGNNWVIIDVDGTLNNAGGAAGATSPLLASEYSTRINNGHQLQLMEMNLFANYTLGRSLDVAATGNGGDVWGSAGFVPVGTITKPFRGQFDGEGATISNLTIRQPTSSDVGLFGHTSFTAVVRDVGLIDSNVSGSMLVGSLIGLNSGAVSNSYATGSVAGRNNVGGLVGVNAGSIDNSYATSSVSGSTSVGGLVGWNKGAISDSYAAGRVSSANTSTIGGLVGFTNGGGSVSGSFWDVTTSGRMTSAGGIGMMTSQMQTQANFTSATTANGNVDPDWDFTNIWFMSGSSYPLLVSFTTSSGD